MLYPYIIIYHDITGWWFGTGFLWLSIGTLMIPTDELIFFQRDRSTSNQCCSTSLSNYIIVTLYIYICSNYTIIYDVHDHLIILSCYFRWPWLHLKHRTMFWKINGESPSWCRAMFDDCLVRLSQASVDISWHHLRLLFHPTHVFYLCTQQLNHFCLTRAEMLNVEDSLCSEE